MVMKKNPYRMQGVLSQGDKQQALYQGLLGLGGQLMASGAPSTDPGAAGRGLAQGAQAFQQGVQSSLDRAKALQNENMQRELMAKKFDEEQAEKARLEAEKARRDQYVSTLPKKLQDAYMIGGSDALSKILVEQSKTPKAGKPVAIAGPDGKPIFVSPETAIGKTPWVKPDKPVGKSDFELWLDVNPNKNYNDYLAATKKPSMTTAEKEYERQITEGSFTGTFSDYLKLLQDREVEQAQALSGAKSEAEAAANRAEQEKVYETFNIGLSNVSEALKGTTTGPYLGSLPALTEEAQTAEGAVAIMAPLLKSLFRQAGEGTFTDKDQELLMKMVPTRNDLPAAANAKIDMIRSVVRSKLDLERLPSRAEEEIALTMPQTAINLGVDPDVWAEMTDEERALFNE